MYQHQYWTQNNQSDFDAVLRFKLV